MDLYISVCVFVCERVKQTVRNESRQEPPEFILLPGISRMQFQCIIIDTKQFNLFSKGV